MYENNTLGKPQHIYNLDETGIQAEYKQSISQAMLLQEYI